MPGKDRVEIDVTPITGRGLPKGIKKATKSLKRKSSDLTLKEVRMHPWRGNSRLMFTKVLAHACNLPNELSIIKTKTDFIVISVTDIL